MKLLLERGSTFRRKRIKDNQNRIKNKQTISYNANSRRLPKNNINTNSCPTSLAFSSKKHSSASTARLSIESSTSSVRNSSRNTFLSPTFSTSSSKQPHFLYNSMLAKQSMNFTVPWTSLSNRNDTSKTRTSKSTTR